MALDLLEIAVDGTSVDAAWLVVRLCMEAGILPECMTEKEGEVELHTATYEVGQGLIVMDEDGKKWRLTVYAEPIK